MPQAQDLIAHLEQFLGPIQRGYSSSTGDKLPFQIIKCSGGLDDTCVYSTLGLSHHRFQCADEGSSIRHEILIAVPSQSGDRNIPALLLQLGEIALHRHHAFLRGEVIGGSHRIFRDKPFTAFYASMPDFAPDEFAVYEGEGDWAVALVWMVPLYESEARYAREKGWGKLEDFFVEQETDLVDLDRERVI
jgi:Suppressor of fused protein (SUFU)